MKAKPDKRTGAKLTGSISSLWPCLSWFLKTLATTIIGFLILAGFLWFMSMISPNLYRALTKWANQPALPIVEECTFTRLDDDSLRASPGMASLRRFSVSFKLDTAFGSKSSAIIFSENSAVGVYPAGAMAIPKATDKAWLVLTRTDFRKSGLVVEVIADSIAADIEEKTYHRDECPILVVPFGGSK